MDWTYSRVPSDLDLKKKKIHREKTKRKLNECIEPICLVDMIPKPEFLQKYNFGGGIPTKSPPFETWATKKNLLLSIILVGL